MLPFLQVLFFIHSTAIARDRGDRDFTFNSTRFLHNVENFDEPGILHTRQLSCYCQACITAKWQCENIDYGGEWKIVKKEGIPKSILFKEKSTVQSHAEVLINFFVVKSIHSSSKHYHLNKGSKHSVIHL